MTNIIYFSTMKQFSVQLLKFSPIKGANLQKSGNEAY